MANKIPVASILGPAVLAGALAFPVEAPIEKQIEAKLPTPEITEVIPVDDIINKDPNDEVVADDPIDEIVLADPEETFLKDYHVKQTTLIMDTQQKVYELTELLSEGINQVSNLNCDEKVVIPPKQCGFQHRRKSSDPAGDYIVQHINTATTSSFIGQQSCNLKVVNPNATQGDVVQFINDLTQCVARAPTHVQSDQPKDDFQALVDQLKSLRKQGAVKDDNGFFEKLF